ncbi:MAG: polyprenyl diphosphate synthase [Moraxella sp.]|uniref:polyprenyl diphosphate synthase n=1 Tax=Moraxella sp. TaxID=479 RepID=UPI0026DBA428|nr:polyprenyl diphosphate synthase [Moraxella sp.]MDO4449760.1 polyprenyl diphosphate synthase [Moraxella sp.]
MNTPYSPNIPKHIAIIMDGNNRYAKRQGLPSGGGHLAGKDSLDPIVEFCAEQGVQVLTVFAFSSENWARPQAEVELLMTLLEEAIDEQLPRMQKNQMRLRFIGDRSKLSDHLQQKMADAESQTAHFDKMTLVIAVSYGGKWDIVQSAKSLITKVKNGEIGIDDIDETAFTAGVSLGDCPPVDMLIRTGGDYRISNFLLWQTAYAELFFTKTLWPDFTPDELSEMMADFGNRERRFGKTSEQVQSQ